jgi:tetratricopeptide (TPR) repeat protein
LHPKLDSDPGSPPIKIFTDTMPLLARRVFTAHYTPFEGGALLSHACANEEFRRSCPYPAFSGFVRAANKLAQPERFAVGPLQLGPFLTAQPFVASAKKLVAEAPYPLVRLVDPKGGAHAVNAGMHTPLTYQFVFNVQLKPEKLYQLGRYEEAISRFQATKAKQFGELQPAKQWVLLMNIGRCQLKLKQFPEAQKSFTTAASHPIAAANENKEKLAKANLLEVGAWLALEHDDPENQARGFFDMAIAAYQLLGKATAYYQEAANYLAKLAPSLLAAGLHGESARTSGEEELQAARGAVNPNKHLPLII